NEPKGDRKRGGHLWAPERPRHVFGHGLNSKNGHTSIKCLNVLTNRIYQRGWIYRGPHKQGHASWTTLHRGIVVEGFWIFAKRPILSGLHNSDNFNRLFTVGSDKDSLTNGALAWPKHFRHPLIHYDRSL